MLRISFLFLQLIFMSNEYVIAEKLRFKAIKLSTGKVQFNQAVVISEEKYMSFCLMRCQQNDKCLTLFYNSGTGRCVLHSENFQYTDPDTVEAGWNMYLYEDKDGRCPYSTTGFFHYRQLDRQTYLKYILVGRPAVRVAIQGHSINPTRTWVLFDGTPLPYTNWARTPLYGDYYLQMFWGDTWTEQRNYNTYKSNMFLCEIR